MSSESQLVLHCGARNVTREELDKVEAPPATSTWFPVKHSAVIDTVGQSLHDAGFTITKTQFGLSRTDNRLFAVIDLSSPLATGVTLAVGVRNSTDKSLPLGFCAGNRVFTCDNLGFRSEILVTRKHTRNGQIRFGEAIKKSVLALTQFQQAESARVKRFQQFEITSESAEALILRAWEKQIVSHRTMPTVLSEFREPSHEEFAESMTLWRLEQAFTSALAPVLKSNPQRYVAATMTLAGLLAGIAGVRPEEEFHAVAA